jgi:REP element-mobilizing transposase RayT
MAAFVSRSNNELQLLQVQSPSSSVNSLLTFRQAIVGYFFMQYRLLTGKLNQDMHALIKKVSLENNYIIDTLKSDIDHLHLVAIEPKISAPELAHQVKQISTFQLSGTIHNLFLKLKFHGISC